MVYHLNLHQALFHSLWQMGPNVPVLATKMSQAAETSFKGDIKGYLDFLGIHDKDHVLEILLENCFHSHKVFKPPGLARADIKNLGLTLGLVTMLFDNVSKYEVSFFS
ncbi:hypothetical protein VP01_1580g1 [Puccinia sorghi]|uniref:Uncharacterized protein n=1 Tax=Puccinia sorghi TaxID=27349 RepID=A0A0L6VHT5_9BASI|nr:hypothetical protein VP01_1580g1 [Puccinia sorghi]